MKIKVKIPWIFLVPSWLLFLELFFTRLYPFSSPYFSLLIFKQPLLLSFHSLVALTRVLLVYVLMASVVELATQAFLKKYARIFVFLSVYALTSASAFSNFPGLLNLFFVPSLLKGTLLSSISAILLLFFSKETTSLKTLGRTLVVTLSFLLFTASTPWTKESSKKKVIQGPSFIVLSFDSVPGEIFSLSEGKKEVAPFWNKHWKEKALNFKNAYTLTNSTYTSWFSLLTGKSPLETGVVSLYPAHRTGNIHEEDWIPRQLQDLGYNTTFLTDCANTSFMRPEFGFDTLYQPDQGAFKSARALVSSVHPGLYWLTQLSLSPLFSELDSFSSHQYDPEVFFEKVRTEWQKLEKDSSPYLLVVHSCLTHRDLAHPTRIQNEMALPAFKHFKSQPLLELMNSLRSADQFTHQFFSQTESGRKTTWRFLLSDHGVRMEPEGDQLKLFSHALGDAVSRYQYNVPLSVLPPRGTQLSNDSKALITIQDLGKFVLTVASSKASNYHFPERQELVLTSSVPTSSPNNWGKTLIPLIESGTLEENGTFKFSLDTERELRQQRSIAILRPPIRSVLSQGKWRQYDEWNDPFNQRPLDLKLNEDWDRYLSKLPNNRVYAQKEDKGN